MDTLEKPATDQKELQELKAQYQSLQQVVSALLVLVLIVAGALDIFSWRQLRMARAELNRRGPQITQFVAEYNQVSAPAISEFVKKLNEYQKTHPDFGPILTKYHLNSGPTGAPPATVLPGKN